MVSFIDDVLKDLQQKSVDFSNLTFILPSKRAGTFLKHELSNIASKTHILSKYLALKSLLKNLSQLQKISSIELLFEFYKVYLKLPQKIKETFDGFLKWAQILFQDFNEIDRYLIDPKHIFDYLSAIKDMSHWSFEENQTTLIKNYLPFGKTFIHTTQSF